MVLVWCGRGTLDSSFNHWIPTEFNNDARDALAYPVDHPDYGRPRRPQLGTFASLAWPVVFFVLSRAFVVPEDMVPALRLRVR